MASAAPLELDGLSLRGPAVVQSSTDPGRPRDTTPGARFVHASDRAEAATRSEREEFLWVSLGPFEAAQRGELSERVDQAVEAVLTRHGAATAGSEAPRPGALDYAQQASTRLSDQLYRARLLEFRGFTLSFDSLRPIADRGGALSSTDSETLRVWLDRSVQRPLKLLFDAGDRDLAIYDVPLRLDHWLKDGISAPARRDLHDERAPLVDGVDGEESEEGEEGEEVRDDDDTATQKLDWDRGASSRPQPEPSIDSTEVPVHATGIPSLALSPIIDDVLSRPGVSAALAEGARAAANPICISSQERNQGLEEGPEGRLEDTRPLQADVSLQEMLLKPVELDAREFDPHADPGALDAKEAEDASASAQYEARRILQDEDAEAAALAKERWRTWLHEIETTRGPKPLAAIERLFTSSYIPLRDAVARGIATSGSVSTLDTWAQSFEQSYREAFDALRMRPKRPTMIADVPSIALRLSRLHGARTTEIVVVDSLRFDLGQRLQRRLQLLLGQKAVLAESFLLWSALPTTTEVQLAVLGGGPAMLRELKPDPDAEIPVARGRAARTLRRVKAGHRDVFKLDVVEASLAEPGPAPLARLDQLADEAAECIAHYFLRLPPRTLVMLFGDHGFRLEALDTGTGPALSGGASPEEVLVPASAWLVGPVH